MSCCGRGGSWFGTCGGAGNIKVDHTWYEGIRACKARAQSKTVMGQQLNVAQQSSHDSSNVPASTSTAYDSDTTNPEPIIVATMTRMIGSPSDMSAIAASNAFVDTAVNESIATSMDKPCTQMLTTASSLASASRSIVAQGCGEHLLNIGTHVSILLIIVL